MCKSPQILVNPRAFYAKNVLYWVLNTVEYFSRPNFNILYNSVSSSLSIAYEEGSHLYYKMDKKCLEFLNNSYVVVASGRIPLFIKISCTKCDECIVARSSSWQSRLKLESAFSGSVVFFTLTYDNQHLPANGLNPSHVSDFIKRFRTHISRYVGEDIKFRVFYCGEYGANTQRPHYHGLLFFEKNLIADIPLFYKIKQVFTHSEYLYGDKTASNIWPFGVVRDFQLPKYNNNSVLASYVSKYVSKGVINVAPAGKTKCFFRGSIRDGGIGFKYLKYLNKDNYIKSSNTLFYTCHNIDC